MLQQATHPRVKSLTATPPTRDRLASRRKERRRQTFWVECLEERCLLSGVTLTGVPNWISEGPAPVNNAQLNAAPNNAASGAVESIAVDPENSSEIFLGTVNGGVWKTTNANPASPGSITWTPLTDNMPSLAIGSVAFDPLDTTGNTIFAGTGSFSNGFDGPQPDGVLRTTDGGTDWSVLASSTFSGQRIKTILPTAINVGTVASPKEVILAATVGNSGTNWSGGGGRLYESMDNGNTFVPLSGEGLPAGYGSVTSLIVDPNNSSQFYAAIPSNGIFRGVCDNTGKITWTEADSSVTGIGAATDITLTAHASGGTVLYAAVSNGNNITGVFTSSNAGSTWTALATPPAPSGGFVGAGSAYNNKINLVADPVANNVVYMSGQGTSNIFRYSPSGAGSWVLISPAQGGSNQHADSRDLQFLNNTTLLESDDGGFYFLPNPTNAANNSWQSFNGNLGATETYNIAYDPNNNFILAGTQDNGTNVQTVANNAVWNQFSLGDGGTVQFDATNRIAYALSDNLSFFFRNSTLPLTPGNNVQLKLASAATPSVNFSGLNAVDRASASTSAATAENNPFVLNATDPTRILIGRTGLYEGSGPNTGDVISDIAPTGMGRASALIYGGFRGGTAEGNVVIVGDQLGQLFYRGETGSGFTKVAGPGFGGITALAVDPQDWRRVYVVQGGEVYVTSDITNTTNNPFSNITYNLGDTTLSGGQLRSITLFDNTPSTAGDSIPIVSGLGGVYRLLGKQWTRYGQALPNTVVQQVQYEPSSDILIAGTFGRGEWEVQNVSTSIASPGILTINGDQDFANEDDTIKLIRDPGNPTLLDVYLNSTTPIGSYPLATIQQINVNGLGGNDTLIVDSSNGLINVPQGIRYDGGTGDNNLELLQTGGPTQFSDTYTVVTNPGQGSDVIVGASGTQTVDFQNLAPVYDNVPAPLTVVGTPSNNTINYEQGPNSLNPAAPYNGDSTGLVTVDNFESLEFSHKTTLTLQGQNGNDSFVVNNTTTPTGLTAISVDGQLGDNTLVVDANNQPVLSSMITAAPAQVNIPVATPIPIGYTNVQQVRVINAQDALTGAAIPFTATLGAAFNNVPVASFQFTDAVPPTILGRASDFVASIDWGDGTVTGGTIVQLAPNAAGQVIFQVLGSHTYTTPGPGPGGSYTVNVVVTDTGSLRSFTPAGGVPVTIQDNAGATTTPSPIASTATIADAALTAQGTTINAVEGTAFGVGTILATFSSNDPNAVAADFTAGGGSVTVNWGDGSPLEVTGGVGSTIAVTQVGTTPNGVVFEVTGGHDYLEEGSYQIRVTIVSANKSQTVAVTQVEVADAPPTAAIPQPAINAVETVQFAGAVAAFSEVYTDGARINAEPITDFTSKPPIIYWGDGTLATVGAVIADPAFPAGSGNYLVLGTHTYADSGVNGGVGHFPVTVTIYDGDGTTALTVTNPANVADVPLTVNGILNPASDSGKFNNDAITNVTQPDFFGTVSEGFAHVSLTATNLVTLVSTPIGTVQADSAGSWNIRSGVALPDGTYAITATAVDQFNKTTTGNTIPPTPIPILNAAGGPLVLVIDTVGPRITAAAFDRLTGTVTFTFQDFPQSATSGESGLLVQSLSDAANYSLNRLHARPAGTFIVTNIIVTPGATPGSDNVAVVFNNGASIKGGYFQIIARAESVLLPSGIQDLAGNALDGEFYGPQSASGNGVPGGDFIANIKDIHQGTPGFGNSGPITIIGTPQPNDPPGHFKVTTKPVKATRPVVVVKAKAKAKVITPPARVRVMALARPRLAARAVAVARRRK